MAETRNRVTTESRGTLCGTVFDDLAVIQNLVNPAISQITVWHAKYIDALMVYYKGQPQAVKNGGPGGSPANILLGPNEFITRIEGNEYAAGCTISRLTFYSNEGRKWGPYGGEHTGTKTFTWDATTGVSTALAPHMGLLYFKGSWGTTMGDLQATFAKYPGQTSKPPSAVKYEVQSHNEDSSQATATLSKFARSIMSVVVTLAVGEEKINMHAYEDVLCRLPFFRAALRTGFKETSDKKIMMPDEEPEIVAALIEFLYVGNYTYTYAPGADTIDTPPCDLKEGSFHLRVYATASKYDYQGLSDVAMKSLIYVLRQIDGIDVIQLLKETYERGCDIALWEAGGDMTAFEHELPVILKRVYVTHAEDMKSIVVECPLLANDLLRLSASAHSG